MCLDQIHQHKTMILDFYKKYKNDSDDVKSLITVYIKMSMMMIKILISSFPLLFIPQNCDDSSCSLNEKFLYWKYFHFMNVFCALSFVNLYYWQNKRETYMIEHFDENDEISENSLTTQIEYYPEIKKRIVILNKTLKKSNIACFIITVSNMLFSYMLIFYLKYLDSMTISVTITNSLLVYNKLFQIYACFTGDDLAQSSVFVKPRIYNCIDKDKLNEKDLTVEFDII